MCSPESKMDKEIVTRVIGPGELVILILTVLDEFNSLTRTVRRTIIQEGCPLRILNAQGSLKPWANYRKHCGENIFLKNNFIIFTIQKGDM